MTEKEAKKILEELGLSLEIKESQDTNQGNNIQSNNDSPDSQNAEKNITEQLPKAGIKIKQGTSVVSYVN